MGAASGLCVRVEGAMLCNILTFYLIILGSYLKSPTARLAVTGRTKMIIANCKPNGTVCAGKSMIISSRSFRGTGIRGKRYVLFSCSVSCKITGGVKTKASADCARTVVCRGAVSRIGH